MTTPLHYFLTVDWCGKGNRGVFADRGGNGFWRDDRPHTYAEMVEILDVFAVLLNPESQPFTPDELAGYRRFVPLAEYSDAYGVVLPQEAV